MAETKEKGTTRSGLKNADPSVEAAVNRLVQAGMTREHALKKIDATLYKCIGDLTTAGIGGLSFLRQMNLSAAMKLNALRVEQANEEDARDGI
jgi:hypothetical protein